jgi:hypothetical protein
VSEVVSEDSVRRNFGKLDEAAGVKWLQEHLDDVVAPLLGEPWVLDADVTVKPLYGHQEGAVVGLQPTQARASLAHLPHLLHRQPAAGVEVEVQPGNQSASKHSAPGLWELLGGIARADWPAFMGGDRD